MKRLLLIAVLAISLILVGCTQQKIQPSLSPTSGPVFVSTTSLPTTLSGTIEASPRVIKNTESGSEPICSSKLTNRTINLTEARMAIQNGKCRNLSIIWEKSVCDSYGEWKFSSNTIEEGCFGVCNLEINTRNMQIGWDCPNYWDEDSNYISNLCNTGHCVNNTNGTRFSIMGSGTIASDYNMDIPKFENYTRACGPCIRMDPSNLAFDQNFKLSLEYKTLRGYLGKYNLTVVKVLPAEEKLVEMRNFTILNKDYLELYANSFGRYCACLREPILPILDQLR